MTPSSPHLATCASFASRLRNAHDFVEVAMVSCATARKLGLHCAMSLHNSCGDPMITVDNAGDSATNIFALEVPILVLTERVGAIRWSSPARIGPELREELATITLHVAVRLAQLGYIACNDHCAELTRRQNQAARLAARGHTNREIAETLALSENTVKKHLKEVFDRLRVSGRAELARRFARLATCDEVPDGITHRAGCTITKHTFDGAQNV